LISTPAIKDAEAERQRKRRKSATKADKWEEAKRKQVSRWIDRANEGDITAQFNLGYFFWRGEGKDISEAGEQDLKGGASKAKANDAVVSAHRLAPLLVRCELSEHAVTVRAVRRSVHAGDDAAVCRAVYLEVFLGRHHVASERDRLARGSAKWHKKAAEEAKAVASLLRSEGAGATWLSEEPELLHLTLDRMKYLDNATGIFRLVQGLDLLVDSLSADLTREGSGACLRSSALLSSADRNGVPLPDGMWILQAALQQVLRVRCLEAAAVAAPSTEGVNEIVASLCQLVSVLCKALGGKVLAKLMASHLSKVFRKCQGDLLAFCDGPTREAVRSAKAAIESVTTGAS
jgi:hypothetical protein